MKVTESSKIRNAGRGIERRLWLRSIKELSEQNPEFDTFALLLLHRVTGKLTDDGVFNQPEEGEHDEHATTR